MEAFVADNVFMVQFFLRKQFLEEVLLFIFFLTWDYSTLAANE